MLGKIGEVKLLNNTNPPLCKYAPRLKSIPVGKTILHTPVRYDAEGRRIVTGKRKK